MKKILSKMKELECYRDFSHYSLWKFFRLSRAANSAVIGRTWPKFELVRDIMVVFVTCGYEEDPIKSEGARVLTRFSPLRPYGSYLLPWKPEFRSNLAKNLMQPFPHPTDASDKIWLQSTRWMQRYLCLKVLMHGRTHARTHVRTPARLPSYHLTL